MAQDQWAILGIEPTNDVQAIKRAYTSLMHEINPEDAPERLQELHSAYKNALAYARDAQTVDDTDRLISDVQPNEDETDSRFDFGDIQADILQQSSTADKIIDDIVFFRENNHLTTVQELSNTPHAVKINLSVTLYQMYRALAETTDNMGVWYTFFDEPLIKYCSKQGGFNEWLVNSFPEDSVHRAKVIEILEDRYKAKHRNDSEIRMAAEADAKEKKKDSRILAVLCIVLALIVVGSIVIFLLRLEDQYYALLIIPFMYVPVSLVAMTIVGFRNM